jgi:hypothetical protein
MRRRQLLPGILAAGSFGCGAGWHQPAQLAPGPWSPRLQAQVWAGGQAQRWHGVVVGSDSISGVPFIRAPDCDSCRRAVPLAQVDSVRIGHPMRGFWNTLGIVIAVPVVLLAVICRGAGCFPDT